MAGVIHIPSKKKFRYLKICDLVDIQKPRSQKPVPDEVARHYKKAEVYDPVIDVDNMITVYGTYGELERSRIFDEVRKNPLDYQYQITFSICNDQKLRSLAKYSKFWGALCRAKLIIDAKRWASTRGQYIVTADDWLKMDDARRFELLKNALGDENQAKVALEYLKPPRRGNTGEVYTGIHLTEHYGVVIIFAIDELYPITEEQIREAIGKEKRLPGWLRGPRRLDEEIVNKIIDSAPIVITKDNVKEICCQPYNQ